MEDNKPGAGKGRSIRHEAALAADEILRGEGYASLVIHRTLRRMDEQAPVEERDRRFFTSLVYTVVKHRETIDERIGALSKTPISRIRPYVLACLRIGAAQLMYMEGVRPYAAISESVELVKRSGMKGLAPYVNGVLRGIQKMDPPADADEADLPVWIKESLSEDYGEDKLRQLLETMDTVRPLCLRLNLTRGSRQEMPEKLKRQLEEQTGRPALLMEGAICPEAVYVHHPGDISRLEMFQKGEISVQDESSMAAVLALDPQKGEKVLDLCGAPGGKSCFCAERMENEGYISCRDIHPHRVDLIRQNAERLGLTILHPGEGDALKPCPEDAEAFDRVLLDAPCSGLGILRSKRDIAEHRSASDVEELSALQETMLETAAAALKPGGRLVYSTCTLTKKENDLQVEAFLAKHPEFELLDIGNLFRKCDPEEVTLRQTATLWPVNEGHDGFFVAAMEKKPRQI